MFKRLLNPTLMYRCAAVLFVLFTLGHTIGFLTLTPESAAARDVYASMYSVKFSMGDDSLFSYGNFYLGFGLFGTLFDVFCAYLAYALARMTRAGMPLPPGLPWAFALLQLGGLVLSVAYFPAPPIVLSALLTAVLGAAAIGVGRADYGRTPPL